MIKVPVGRSQDNRSSSVLSYTPLTTMDFGTIMCTAMNMVGTQKNPCVFHIIMAGQEKYGKGETDPKKRISYSFTPKRIIEL